MKIVNTLVIPDRTEERIQPEIFYSFKDAAKRNKTDKPIEFKFYDFNPYIFPVEPPLKFAHSKQRIMDLCNQTVDTVIEIKKNTPEGTMLFDAILDYIKEHKDSPLSKLKGEVEKVLSWFSFLIIESTAKTIVHPIFYRPDVFTKNAIKAVADDIKDTLYGLLFVQAAFDQDKPIFATCHGAQLGYLHAGGGLTKMFKEKGSPYSETYYARKNPHEGPEELWQIDVELNARQRDDLHVFSTLKYPLPDIFKHKGEEKKEKYINKDFRHTIAMTAPIPDTVEVLSFHPLSSKSRKDEKYEIRSHPAINEDQLIKFKGLLKDIPVVDAFRYKTMLGFQYHPHYTYDDLDTSSIFDYLINDIIDSVYK